MHIGKEIFDIQLGRSEAYREASAKVMKVIERADRNTKGGIDDGLINGILEAIAKQVVVAETDAFLYGFESAKKGESTVSLIPTGKPVR